MNSHNLLIIGLGNEFVSDDGVGIHVLRKLKRIVESSESQAQIVFEELAVGGLALLDHILGFEYCIIIDAVVTGNNPPGTMYRFQQNASHAPVRLTTSHQTDLSQILRLARLFNQRAPQNVTVYGVEAEDVLTFNAQCTHAVEQAIPKLVEIIQTDITGQITSSLCTSTGAPLDQWEILLPIPTELS
jgi:hydrogenase maturation protease